MSWGHVVSKDLLNWCHVATSPALVPDKEYDSRGAFTGCWIPNRNKADKELNIAYSSVNKLPFHWSTPPYPRNSAGLSRATSYDAGKTWIKSSRNPILKGEPLDTQVTGFRDPYVTELPGLDKARGAGSPTLYALISGGIEGSGPTSFLYEIQQESIEHWNYLGPLVDVPARFQPSEAWNGNYGMNWECTNMFTLHAGSESRTFLLIGAEGDVEKDHIKQFPQRIGAPSRTVRSQLWMSGHFASTSNGVRFHYDHGGYFDHGPYYAANSFLDPVSGRRIVHGWIPEEDITIDVARRKGWNGSLAIPREVFLLQIRGVYKALRSALSEISCFEVIPGPDGSNTVLTMGVRPINEMLSLREKCGLIAELQAPIWLPESGSLTAQSLFSTQSHYWELEAIVEIRPECEEVGFHLYQGEDMSSCTTVTFSTTQETITVDREKSNTEPSMNKCPDAGKFTLLTIGAGNDSTDITLEKLLLRIFFDQGILEVFANDRFALATMIYPPCAMHDTVKVTAFAKGKVGSAEFKVVRLWDKLGT